MCIHWALQAWCGLSAWGWGPTPECPPLAKPEQLGGLRHNLHARAYALAVAWARTALELANGARLQSSGWQQQHQASYTSWQQAWK